jgi:hypothetical protein
LIGQTKEKQKRTNNKENDSDGVRDSSRAAPSRCASVSLRRTDNFALFPSALFNSSTIVRCCCSVSLKRCDTAATFALACCNSSAFVSRYASVSFNRCDSADAFASISECTRFNCSTTTFSIVTSSTAASRYRFKSCCACASCMIYNLRLKYFVPVLRSLAPGTLGHQIGLQLSEPALDPEWCQPGLDLAEELIPSRPIRVPLPIG